MSGYPAFKVAVAHVAPVFLDLAKTLDKACSLIGEAAQHGARLIAFPETYLPAFPVWSALRSPIYNHDLFCRLAADAMLVPGPEVDRIRSMARECDIVVSLGLNERSEASLGCIYNSNLLIDHQGTILNHHRKIVPTFYEKLTWAAGDGAGLRVCDTPCGRIGMLICGENTNPLARYTMIAQGEQVHVSSYPPIWPTHDPAEGNNYDLAAAIRLRAGAHSLEAKAFNVVASGYMDAAMRDTLAALHPDAARILDDSPRSISLVTGPSGEAVSQVLCDDEGMLYVDIDVADCVAPKQIHDISGGYNRFDIFQLSVDRSANRPVTFRDEEQPVNQEGVESHEPTIDVEVGGAARGQGDLTGLDRAQKKIAQLIPHRLRRGSLVH